MSLHDEGHTIAGWTGFAVATAGTGLLGAGVCTTSWPLAVVGLVLAGVSVLVTWALHLSGWGKPPGVRSRGQWGMRARDTGARAGHPGCVSCRLAGRGAPPEHPGPLSASPGASSDESIPLSPIE
ncbi:HGxxPAAW family protein [Streptomyces sp. NPDC090108]|uniref:HGxxPAAW family protein n=1 Tax=Streptomyces sp. NPDC090108 TaxID=3365947 RepID=UPI0038114EAF